MRLRRVQNRVYNGKQYDRWILTIPEEIVVRLGWSHGLELHHEVVGIELRIRSNRIVPPSTTKVPAKRPRG
jgi:hypothetical protein